MAKKVVKKAQPYYYTPRPGHRDCPDFSSWSKERLQREAKRLGMPNWEQKNKNELVMNLIEAYT